MSRGVRISHLVTFGNAVVATVLTLQSRLMRLFGRRELDVDSGLTPTSA